MHVTSFTNFSANWSDLTSLLLLFATILSNGLKPCESLRGFTFPQKLLQFLTMGSLLVFTIFRFIVEALNSMFVHRHFLVISTLYIIQWLHHFYKLHSSSKLECRFSRVGKAVADLSTIHVGTSTYPERKGDKEIVVRTSTDKATGKPYWRGTIQSEKRIGNVWMVYLTDEHIHEDTLLPLTNAAHMKNQQNSLDDLYQSIFQTVMTVEDEDDSHIDLSPFLERFAAIKETDFAVRAGATGDSDLAGVARRIAADACEYLSGRGDFRTEQQIQLLNLCVEKAALQTCILLSSFNQK